MRLRVAALSVTIEQTPSPITASVSSGSSGSRRVLARDCSSGPWAAWIAVDGPIRLVAFGGLIGFRARGSKCPGVSGHELLGLAEPLRGHQASDRRRGFRPEAALLDRHRQQDRAIGVGDVAHVPGLVFLADMLRRSR